MEKHTVKRNPKKTDCGKDRFQSRHQLGHIKFGAKSLLHPGKFLLKQIDSASLKSLLGKEERVLKLRNASGVTEWKGTGNQNDKIFWDQIETSEEKEGFI